ncbi:MAG: ATP-binding protein [Ruminococcus sp.]|nr:ATP-binding protein [Ruminococcus sp.]
MAKVVMICGKISCGKSTYAEQMCIKNNAVLLSVDEIMLALFDQNAGDKHDEYVKRVKKFLFNKSIGLIKIGIDVILDWGFWTKCDRKFAREFYRTHDIKCELHYIDIDDELWKLRLNKRNNLILSGKTDSYFVDDNLAKKFNSIFEIPDRDEIDLWVRF